MKYLLAIICMLLAVSAAAAKGNSNFIVFDKSSPAIPTYGDVVTFDALGGTQIELHCYQGRTQVYFSLNWNMAAYDSNGNFLGYGTASFTLSPWDGNAASCTASVGSWQNSHFHSTASLDFDVLAAP